MIHEKRIKHLEDHQFVLENKLQKNLGSCSAVSPWLNKYPMPKFSGHKRERSMRFLKDFERNISTIDISSNDFNYIIYACLEGIAREWRELVSQIQGIKTDALIDTGREITCISENFFENNKNKFKNCKILPIIGTSVVGATGVKPIKLKHQLYADLNVNDETHSCVFIIIYNPYINPLVTSLKKDRRVRICLDARKLNDIIINDYECAEPPEVLFQRCGGSKIMSTMDLTSNFWQIPLAEESKKYTAFLHEGKCYEFYVTPFGLKTSTAALVRTLEFVLNGLGNFCVTFIDDIFCASENVHQHLLHLELLFHRLMENNLTINLEKSHFFRSEVKFLGHILTSTGIKPDS